MEVDGGVLRSEGREYSDALDGLYPLERWYDPCDRAFQGLGDLETCYSWSRRCARALDELKKNLVRFEDEEYLPVEALLAAGSGYSFITAILALTVAQIEYLGQQDAFEDITQRLAARRLIEFGNQDALPTICDRRYPSALDGLLDVHKRVNGLAFGVAQPVMAAVESAIPNVMAKSILNVPFYAGRAENEFVPADGLDPSSVHALAKSVEFKEAVAHVYQKTNRTRVFAEVHSFQGQEVVSMIKGELSLLIHEPTNSAQLPAPANNDRVGTSDPSGNSAPPEPRMSRCHANALGEYLLAAKELGGNPTDQQAYEWLNENEKRMTVSLGTWTRYLRIARNTQGLQKNHPRAGRTGRSVARWDQIEPRLKRHDRTTSG